MMNETVVTVERTVSAPPPPAGGAAAPPRLAAGGVGTGTTTRTGGALSWIQFNYQYFLYTIPGYLKIAELILGILCMALASPALIAGTHWFLFVAVTSFIATLLWTFVYLLGIREVLNIGLNWILTELLNTGISTLLYFIAFIVQLAGWSPLSSSHRGANIAAGVFGLFNTIAYAGSTYLLYLEHRTTLPR